MSVVVKPLDTIYGYNARSNTEISVFLSGSIECGNAPQWQIQFSELMKDESVVLFDPRRDDWDNSWVQSKDDPNFYGQVNWELFHIELSDIVIVNMCSNTYSPITLLELGIVSGKSPDRLIVHCPKDYFRHGNVDIVCSRYGVQMVDSFDELVTVCKERLRIFRGVINDRLKGITKINYSPPFLSNPSSLSHLSKAFECFLSRRLGIEVD